jgi:hypothetical protein
LWILTNINPCSLPCRVECYNCNYNHWSSISERFPLFLVCLNEIRECV